MRKINKLRAIMTAGAVAAFVSTDAQAQAVRTFVSGHGLDTNPCSLASPCRSFAQAITLTNPGGEITVLDTAGYGALTITKAISIVNPGGVEAGITVAAGHDAITINAGPNDKIALRGLTVEGAGVGANGIVFNSGANLDIENSVVRNFTVDGIHLSPTVDSTFSILNTVVSDNAGVGIFIIPTGAVAIQGAINEVASNNNYDGILLDGANSTLHFGTNTVTVSRSVANNNKYAGFYCAGADRTFMALSLQNVTAGNNQYGIKGDGTAYVPSIHTINSVSINNSISDAFSYNGASVISYGNNVLPSTSGVTQISPN